MVGLLDIAPASSEVHGVTIYGVSAESIAYLVKRFPDLAKMISGKKVEGKTILDASPEAVAPIIAAACGYAGNEEAEKIANRFGIDAQLDLLGEIARLTLPDGVGPFVERIVEISVQFKAEIGKATDTISPKESQRSSPAVSVPRTSGL